MAAINHHSEELLKPLIFCGEATLTSTTEAGLSAKDFLRVVDARMVLF